MKSRLILLHISLWTVYILLYSALWSNVNASFSIRILSEISLLPFKVILVYAAIGVFVPKFLFRKKYFIFFLTLFLTMIICGILHHLYVYYVQTNVFGETYPPESLWNVSRITKRMTYINTPMLLAITLVVLDKYYVQKEINTRIVNEKLSAELKLLKNQLQPHFFFNTLNNLYSLALHKSDLTPMMILKLSELMRYSLDQSEKDSVPLQEEIEFIRNYVALEEMRYRDKVMVTWNIQVSDATIYIPPLILSTFIENVFKHSVSQAREEIRISLSLIQVKGHLHYTVINTLPTIIKDTDNGYVNTTGLGLNNLKQRLELIYQQQYTLKTESNGDFMAHLIIPISA